jgi:hypothetical protein
MTERERWIVYPLVFFALGAALRDKFLQQVSTKEMFCQRLQCEGPITCEGVVVLDANNKRQPLVQLGRIEPPDGAEGQNTTETGVLILRDNQGRELGVVSNNELFVKKISCESLSVVDPKVPPGQPPRVLAGLWTALAQAAGAPPQSIGVLFLNQKFFAALSGSPPRTPTNPDEAPAQPAPDDDPNTSP